MSRSSQALSSIVLVSLTLGLAHAANAQAVSELGPPNRSASFGFTKGETELAAKLSGAEWRGVTYEVSAKLPLGPVPLGSLGGASEAPDTQATVSSHLSVGMLVRRLKEPDFAESHRKMLQRVHLTYESESPSYDGEYRDYVKRVQSMHGAGDRALDKDEFVWACFAGAGDEQLRKELNSLELDFSWDLVDYLAKLREPSSEASAQEPHRIAFATKSEFTEAIEIATAKGVESIKGRNAVRLKKFAADLDQKLEPCERFTRRVFHGAGYRQKQSFSPSARKAFDDSSHLNFFRVPNYTSGGIEVYVGPILERETATAVVRPLDGNDADRLDGQTSSLFHYGGEARFAFYEPLGDRRLQNANALLRGGFSLSARSRQSLDTTEKRLCEDDEGSLDGSPTRSCSDVMVAAPMEGSTDSEWTIADARQRRAELAAEARVTVLWQDSFTFPALASDEKAPRQLGVEFRFRAHRGTLSTSELAFPASVVLFTVPANAGQFATTVGAVVADGDLTDGLLPDIWGFVGAAF